MKKEMICIICPKGCILKVNDTADAPVTVANVSGNKCKRGAVYAVDERTNPVRVLTSTVKLAGGVLPVAPVKSSKPLPKKLLFDCMKVINGYTAAAPLKVGDIVIKDILGTGTDIISTSNIPKA